MTGIPRPLVRANQSVIVGVVLLALALQQVWPVALLFAVLLVGLVGGPKVHLILRLGRWALRSRLAGAPQEDPASQRFNQSLAVSLLGVSLAAHAMGHPGWGWALAVAVALAAGVALSGFCVGCFLYYQVRMLRFRWERRRA